jgi:hypothetical protein
MTKLSRDKSARIERELVALHAEIGVWAERVPLRRVSRYRGCSAKMWRFLPQRCPALIHPA